MPNPIAKVLVVDDDPLQRQLVATLLAGCGYLVDTAADGREALERVRVGRPEVVLTDSEMPIMDGVTLCRLIKGNELIQTTYVIFLSAHGGTSAKVTALEVGAD